MTWFELIRRMDDLTIEERLAKEEFYRIGQEWAEMQPDSEWTPGLPPKSFVDGFYVAVRTETGKTLVGTLRVFAKSSAMIALDRRYGKILQWIPFGEPE